MRTCIDFIELHTEEPLPVKLLAERIGYSEYHLSRKFHQEMGMTIKHMIPGPTG